MTYGELLRGSLAWDAGRTLPPGDLPGRVLEGLRPPPGKPPAPPDQPAERLEALRRERGHVASAAGDLQMPVRQLYRKIKKYSIQVEKFRVWD